MNFTKLATPLLLSLTLAVPTMAGLPTYVTDTKTSTIQWTGQKITGSTTSGVIKLKSGQFYVMEDQIAGGEFVIDMSTIESTDMSADQNARLSNHLKNDDFFSVDKFPIATLSISKGIKVYNSLETDPNYEFEGTLTIKGITQDVKFGAIVTMDDKTLKAMAVIVFDRSKFDVRYGSGSFFEDLGNKLILDDIKLTIEINANIQAGSVE